VILNKIYKMKESGFDANYKKDRRKTRL